MSEFENRIDAQRSILKLINEYGLYEEPLLSLSGKAIERWIIKNKIDENEDFVLLIKRTSERLFFLANKSQEQITEDYKNVSIQILRLKEEILEAMANKASLSISMSE